MGFLKDLLAWFFRGDDAAIEEEMGVSVSEARAVEVKTHRAPKTVEFDIFRGVNTEAFLKDLQSIHPVPDSFDKARKEFIEELKKLAPPSTRPNFHVEM